VCRGATTVVIEHARSLPHADVCALVGRGRAGHASDRSHDRGPRRWSCPSSTTAKTSQDVALATGLTVDEVVALHCGATYTVAFVGFGAGFGYLTGLHPRLHLPRRAAPRPWVPAGAVAIAMGYTGVYPRATPGGWHLLGRTDAAIWDPTREPPGLFLPGRRVRFVPVAAGADGPAIEVARGGGRRRIMHRAGPGSPRGRCARALAQRRDRSGLPAPGEPARRQRRGEAAIEIGPFGISVRAHGCAARGRLRSGPAGARRRRDGRPQRHRSSSQRATR
jgi:hypothetical protein